MVGLSPGRAAASDPTQWPAVAGSDPNLTATPDTIRYSGPDRYQTNLALNLGLRGTGGFPFDTSDPTSGNASGLAHASGWWGAATCPRTIILVAADTFADALTAASLSDPTDRSGQPRLERVAAADPVFDPIGGFDRPDTAYAPIVVTQSARSGATGLTPSARLTASDLASGGCTSARNAVIVGGSSAVPVEVQSELVSLGYREVFRVAGADRYDTAARVAVALGTSAPAAGTTCADSDSTDGSTSLGWYGNAVPEYRSGPQSCTLLPRAVVLADGGTGADALAAGWWTSRWQVPVLLTAPDGTLPAATRTALSTLDIDTLVVLGGVSRIPESTVDEAKALAGAVAGRIAGGDRYATSVEMAKAFGGWWPTGNGRDFANDVACVAASSGNGAASNGWPDALAAGPWCARLGAAGVASPARALAPVTGANAAVAHAGGVPAAHSAVPVLLVPTSSDVPASVQSFLTDAFTPTSAWCSSDSFTDGCLGPGFAAVIGGAASVSPDAEYTLTNLISGGFGGDRGDQSPSLDGGFATTLDLSPIYATTGTGDRRLCFPGGAMANVRWLSLTADPARRTFLGELDVLRQGDYVSGSSRALCNAVSARGEIDAAGVSLSGVVSAVHTLHPGDVGVVTMTAPVLQPGTSTPLNGGVLWHFDGPPVAPVAIARDAAAQTILRSTLDLTLTVAPAGSSGVVAGSAAVQTPFGVVNVTVRAAAVRTGTAWEIRGSARLDAGQPDDSSGGFTATVDLSGATPTVSWRLDGFPTGT